jgi:hypothetical protein
MFPATSDSGFQNGGQPLKGSQKFVKEADDVTLCKGTSMFVGWADAIARAFGKSFWAPADYAHLAQQLLTVLEDGIAMNDTRCLRVKADGRPWVAASPSKYFGQV